MVRRLERRDLGLVKDFLRRRLPHSFPILGEMERTDPRVQERELWGLFAADELRTVLARSSHAAHVCGPDESATEELTGLLVGFSDLAELDGQLETLAPYTCKFSLGASHRQFIAYLQPVSFTPRVMPDLRVTRAAYTDAEPIAALWCRRLTAEDRARTAGVLRARLAGHTDRIYIGKSGGIPVTTASTGQESASLALIRCTYTDPDLREHGWATACLSVLCRDLLAEGKTVVVLTETLADARIYRRVGFVPAGPWVEWKRQPA